MRKQPEILSHQLTTNKVAAMLDQAPSPFTSQINVPAGAANTTPDNINPEVKEFANIINNFAATSINTQTEQAGELKFGAPQIDLSLPEGTLAKDGIHQFNPKHFRDQEKAFQCALLLAARQRATQSGSPLFCFLTEDQTSLIEWLSGPALNLTGLSTDDLVIITAKHSDELLWAMEETLHTTNTPALVAHFTLLDNLSAQRLAYAAKRTNTPCLLICNHKIEGPIHTRSQWAVEEITNVENTDDENQFNVALSLSGSFSEKMSDREKDNLSTNELSWSLKWQSDKGRFSALLNQASPHNSATLH